MSLTFQEKSLWLMFAGLTATFGFYFATVLPTRTVDVMPHQVVLFVLACVILVISQIAGHIVVAFVARHTEADERDRLIELKGTRNAAYALATGVCLSLFAALVTEGNFIFTHVLLAFWIVSHLVEIGSQLFLYRHGV